MSWASSGGGRLRRPQHFSALGLSLLALGCGYRFSASGGPLPHGVTEFYVPNIKNQTSEAGLEALLTTDLRRELVRTGREGGPGCPVRLEGVIESVTALPIALKAAAPLQPNGLAGTGPLAAENPGLYQVTVTATLKLWRGAELLSELDHVAWNESYLPADDLATLEANRRLALRRAAQGLAREIFVRLTAG